MANSKITKKPQTPMIRAGLANSLSFLSCLCSLIMASLAAEIFFLDNIISSLLFPPGLKPRIYKSIKDIHRQVYQYIQKCYEKDNPLDDKDVSPVDRGKR